MENRLAIKGDIKGLTRIHVESWRTTYEGIVDPAFLEIMSIQEREDFWTTMIKKIRLLLL